jgi:hypothetical protein
MIDSQRFVDLRRPRRIWAVAAVHAEADRLAALHDALGSRFRPGDRLIYLGNLIGRGSQVTATVEELLMFRRALLAAPGLDASDIVYLRGCQEEMWQKLLQVQLAPNPYDVMAWMLSQGIGSTLAAYGASEAQALAAARDGVRTVTRFTNTLRVALRAAPGHEALYSALRRAAFTGSPTAAAATPEQPGGVLLVSAGFDPAKALEAQGDAFWWGNAGFAGITQRCGGFQRVVRGYDPAHGGITIGAVTTTLDAGCGFGGPLVCGCLTPSGELLDTLNA